MMTWVVAWTQGKMVDQFTGHVPDERIDEFLDNLLAVKLEVAAPAPDVGRGSETQDCARVSVCPVSCLSGLRAAIALTRSHAANVSSLLRRPWTTMTRRHCRRRVTRHVFLRSCISRTEFFEFKLCQ